VAQAPAANTPSAPGTVVTVDYYDTVPPVAVPSVVGVDPFAACGAVQAVGLQCAANPGAAAGVPPGIVYAQDQPPGTLLAPGSLVNVAFESSVPLYEIRGMACDGYLMRVWYLTVDVNLRNQLIGPGQCGGQPGPPEYVIEGGEPEVVGYVYTTQQPGTIPVYDCHYPWPSSRHWQHAFSTSTHGAPWQACDFAGFYVYAGQVDGNTRPVYAMFETSPPPSPNIHSDGEGHVVAANDNRRAFYEGYGFRVYETWYVR
jgi:hypothetical protein